jgi:hypothetical protein
MGLLLERLCGLRAGSSDGTVVLSGTWAKNCSGLFRVPEQSQLKDTQPLAHLPCCQTLHGPAARTSAGTSLSKAWKLVANPRRLRPITNSNFALFSRVEIASVFKVGN